VTIAAGLDRARALGARESGLAVVTTIAADGLPHSSVVNAGVVDRPGGGGPVVAFVARGGVRKLDHLRAHPHATVVFRSGWDWVAIAGEAELVGPQDPSPGIAPEQLLDLLCTVYAAAVGGTPSEWTELAETMVAEGHTAVLVRPDRAYPAR
jgi:PPOX class probable F420-dependent enzyme